MKVYKDCLACAKSFSEEGNDGKDKLFCMLHQKYVEEHEVCNDFN